MLSKRTPPHLTHCLHIFLLLFRETRFVEVAYLEVAAMSRPIDGHNSFTTFYFAAAYRALVGFDLYRPHSQILCFSTSVGFHTGFSSLGGLYSGRGWIGGGWGWIKMTIMRYIVQIHMVILLEKERTDIPLHVLYGTISGRILAAPSLRISMTGSVIALVSYSSEHLRWHSHSPFAVFA
jgi:hypothetical protein